MYTIHHKKHQSYDPRAGKGKAHRLTLAAEGRAVPAVASWKGGRAATHVYDGPNWIHSNGKSLQPTRSPSLLEATAATSAFFAPLADDQMRHLVDRKLFRVSRLLLWFLRWRTMKNQRPFRIRDLAPKMQLDASTVVRTGDGCLWDTRALATALWGLVHDRQHHASRPIVFVLATERFNIREWWADENRRNDLFPEPALFSGKIGDHRERTTETSQGFCYVYTRCVVRRESCAISGWMPDDFSVDVVVMVVLAEYLNSLPFNKFRKWGLFEDTSCRSINGFFDALHLQEMTKGRPFGVAISGGGARTAILGAAFMRMLDDRRLVPLQVAATSGGAWGVILHALGHRAIHPVMVNNMLRIHRTPRVEGLLLAAIRAWQNSENTETMRYMLTTLMVVDYDWERLVRLLLFPDDAHPPTWDRVFARLPWRVSFPFVVLASSHAN